MANAVKYGGRPPVLTLGYDDDAADHIRFWVRDNGPGLAAAPETLFKPGARITGTSGHGFGLSIVKRIILRLNGTVGVDSVAKQGSTFWFTLPVPVAADANTA